MNSIAHRRVAVVGAGPAGIYFADAMIRLEPALRIDVIERLPFPFGLVRYGVAADHQGTKAVAQILARTMKRPRVRYFGGVEVGRDISLRELHEIYDAVVLATGACAGRKLEFTGADHPDNIAAFDLARWLNGHPDYLGFRPRPARAVAIVGNGNVSLDMIRLLGKPVDELAKLDLSLEGVAWLRSNQIEEINVIGRGGVGATKFSSAELEEIGQLAHFQPRVRRSDIGSPGEITNAAAFDVLRRFAEAPIGDVRPVNFHFDRKITAFDSGKLNISNADGRTAFAADLVIHAVGQDTFGVPDAASAFHQGPIQHSNGAVSSLKSTFVVGWASGTGRGTIPDSRANAQDVAQVVSREMRTQQSLASDVSLEELLDSKSINFVSWQSWQQIDRSEIECGRLHGKLRHKFRSLDECASELGLNHSQQGQEDIAKQDVS